LSSFGYQLAIGSPGPTIVAGICKVWQYSGSGTTWSQIGNTITGPIGENTGRSVSLNDAGDIVAVGSPRYSTDIGRVQVYKYDGVSTWVQLGSDITTGTSIYLGNVVCLNFDGTVLAATGLNTSGVIYKYLNNVWTNVSTLSTYNSSELSLNSIGNVVGYQTANTITTISSVPFYNIAIGDQTGNTFQNMYAVGIGYQSGVYSQGLAAVAIGCQAGQTQQGFNAVAIGYQAGQTGQGSGAIAIGYQAGITGQGSAAIAIGYLAGNKQYDNTIAIGTQAGYSLQSTGAIAIGYQAGQTRQGTKSIAIGCLSGGSIDGGGGLFSQGENSIAIGLTIEGLFILRYSNTIMLNATDSVLTSQTSSAFYVKPIRSAPAASTYRNLLYNATTYEIVYNAFLPCSEAKTFIIDHPDDPQNKYLVHACLEGPEAGVFYRGKGTIQNNRSVVITLPQYVRKLAYDFTLQLTPIRTSPTKPSQLTSSKVINGLFTVYGANGSFFWLVYAKRHSIEAEMPKSTTKVYGDGPYKYHL
jgi:hypothetical protein